MVEILQVERWAAVVHECSDTIFLSFALIVVMMVVMSVMVMTFFIFPVVMVVVMMFVVFVFMFMLVFFFVLMLIFIVMAFEFANPCGRSNHLFKIEQACVENLVEIHIAIVTF